MSAVIFPVVLLVVVGLIAGIILTVASRLMFVPVDETVLKLSEALPGANCGGCGFAGCDDYANAMGEDRSLSCSLCPVGGPEVAAKLAEILGVSAGDAEPTVATVMCKGNCNVTNEVMTRDRLKTCKEASMFYGGGWACTFGCMGLGDCEAACDFNAIKVFNGVAVVDRENCVGCKACANACPKHIIDMVPKSKLVYVACNSKDKGAVTRKKCSSGCIGCMKCQKTCKFEAISVENGLAKVDYEKCKNCGLCVKECPTGAIITLRKKKAAKPKMTPEQIAEAKAKKEAAAKAKAEAAGEAPAKEEAPKTEAPAAEAAEAKAE